jgi:hypothetical protein
VVQNLILVAFAQYGLHRPTVLFHGPCLRLTLAEQEILKTIERICQAESARISYRLTPTTYNIGMSPGQVKQALTETTKS